MPRATSGTACRSVVVKAASTSMRDPYDCRMEDFGPENYGDRVAGVYALVFIVFNTFFQLYSQEAQLRCFANVAAHLRSGGRFVIHAFVPDTSRVESGEHLAVKEASLDRVRLDASVFDASRQRLDT